MMEASAQRLNCLHLRCAESKRVLVSGYTQYPVLDFLHKLTEIPFSGEVFLNVDLIVKHDCKVDVAVDVHPSDRSRILGAYFDECSAAPDNDFDITGEKFSAQEGTFSADVVLVDDAPILEKLRNQPTLCGMQFQAIDLEDIVIKAPRDATRQKDFGVRVTVKLTPMDKTLREEMFHLWLTPTHPVTYDTILEFLPHPGLIKLIETHRPITDPEGVALSVPLTAADLDQAIVDANIATVLKLFESMASSANKKEFEDAGLLQKAENSHKELGNKKLDETKQKYGEKFSQVKARLERNNPQSFKLILASSPEMGAPSSRFDGWPVLQILDWAVKACGCCNVAGDADDTFHKLLMDPQEMTEKAKGWRSAWKGSLKATVQTLPEDRLKFLSAKGGRETQWERRFLQGEPFKQFCDCHKKAFEVECFDDLESCLEYLSRLE